jgi:hypothetical protein
MNLPARRIALAGTNPVDCPGRSLALSGPAHISLIVMEAILVVRVLFENGARNERFDACDLRHCA